MLMGALLKVKAPLNLILPSYPNGSTQKSAFFQCLPKT